jgi:hypothetical protein
LHAASQNRWPSLHTDVGRVNDVAVSVLSRGLLLQDLHVAEEGLEGLYEPIIRRAAGLGEAPTRPDPDRYAQRYAHCDVLVVGAGPAGIAAALAAADSGARVILCDEQALSAAACWATSPHASTGTRARVGATIHRSLAIQSARHPARPHDRLRLFPAQFHRS